jgi:hypothetical protein
MKIKANEPLKTLKGEDLKQENEVFTVGEAISNILLADQAGGKMKTYILAQRFATEKTVEVDKADLSLIKTAIEATKVYSNLVTGQLLVMLEGIKE